MDQRYLHRMLTELHEELTSTYPVDRANRELLEQLAGDIDAIVTREPSAVAQEQYGRLRARLVEVAATLEAAHPRIADAVERVVDTLALFNL